MKQKLPKSMIGMLLLLKESEYVKFYSISYLYSYRPKQIFLILETNFLMLWKPSKYYKGASPVISEILIIINYIDVYINYSNMKFSAVIHFIYC